MLKRKYVGRNPRITAHNLTVILRPTNTGSKNDQATNKIYI